MSTLLLHTPVHILPNEARATNDVLAVGMVQSRWMLSMNGDPPQCSRRCGQSRRSG